MGQAEAGQRRGGPSPGPGCPVLGGPRLAPSRPLWLDKSRLDRTGGALAARQVPNIVSSCPFPQGHRRLSGRRPSPGVLRPHSTHRSGPHQQTAAPWVDGTLQGTTCQVPFWVLAHTSQGSQVPSLGRSMRGSGSSCLCRCRAGVHPSARPVPPLASKSLPEIRPPRKEEGAPRDWPWGGCQLPLLPGFARQAWQQPTCVLSPLGSPRRTSWLSLPSNLSGSLKALTLKLANQVSHNENISCSPVHVMVTAVGIPKSQRLPPPPRTGGPDTGDAALGPGPPTHLSEVPRQGSPTSAPALVNHGEGPALEDSISPRVRSLVLSATIHESTFRQSYEQFKKPVSQFLISQLK